MCLIITLLAAIVTTALWRFSHADGARKLSSLCLMYWGAALMWAVDGFFRLAEGEPFLELTGNDALLGAVVVACGVVGWQLTLLWNRRKARIADSQS